MSDLLKINVNDHTEKKGQLTYLSWAWAWAEVLKIDPQATWEAFEFNGLPVLVMPDATAMVKVMVRIKGDAKSSWLPVMDNRNKAIVGPDAFQVNTAIMRCMAKAIAMHGLGLYIYAGEDLPEGEPESKPEPKAPRHTPTGSPEIDPRRQNIIADVALAIGERMRSDDLIGAYEEYLGIVDNEEKIALWKLLSSEIRAALKKHGESLKDK